MITFQFSNDTRTILILMILLMPSILLGQNSLSLSTQEDFIIQSVNSPDEGILLTDFSGSWSRQLTSMTNSLPPEADIDALEFMSMNDIYFSLNIDIDLDGNIFADEDIIHWDGTNFKLFWDGSGFGIPETADVDALDIISSGPLDMIISTNTDFTFPGLVVGDILAADEDLVRYEGLFGLTAIAFDGSSAGIPPEADLDGVTVKNDSTWYMSFNIGGNTGTVAYDQADLLEWNPNTSSFQTSPWFDASSEGFAANVNLNASKFATPTPVPQAPVADFNGTPLEGWAPLNVCFQDQSNDNGNPITLYEWDFDNDGVIDGTGTSTNICYTYDEPGTYSVSMTATNTGGSDTETKFDYVEANYAFPYDNPGDEGWEPWFVSPGTNIPDPLGSFYVAPTYTQSSVIAIENKNWDSTFGYWTIKNDTPIKDADSGTWYKATCQIRTDQGDVDKAPKVRIRIMDQEDLSVTSMEVDSGPNAFPTSYRSIEIFHHKPSFESVVGHNMKASFDLIDLTANQIGDLFCEKATFQKYTVHGAGISVVRYDSDSDFQNWTTIAAPSILDVVTSGTGTGSLWLESPGPTGSKNLYFGGWQVIVDSSQAFFQSGRQYEARFTLRSENVQTQENMPTVRIRFSNASFDWTIMRIMRQIPGTYQHMPPVGGRTYSIFMNAPPNLTGTPSEPVDSMVLNLDLVDADENQSGRVYLDKVEVIEY